MTVAMVFGAWALTSLFLGLLLGGLFRTFAWRRSTEEDPLAWLEKMRFRNEASPVTGATQGVTRKPVPVSRPRFERDFSQAAAIEQWEGDRHDMGCLGPLGQPSSRPWSVTFGVDYSSSDWQNCQGVAGLVSSTESAPVNPGRAGETPALPRL